MVSFPLVKEPETSLLAWTTTPWSLPGYVLRLTALLCLFLAHFVLLWSAVVLVACSNLGVNVHPDFVYVKIRGRNTPVLLCFVSLGCGSVALLLASPADHATGKQWIVAESRLSQLYPAKKKVIRMLSLRSLHLFLGVQL